MEVEITTENFESYKNGELPLVVDLWATWCGPCKMIGPIISELANEYDGKIVVGKCNIEDNDDVAIDLFSTGRHPSLMLVNKWTNRCQTLLKFAILLNLFAILKKELSVKYND